MRRNSAALPRDAAVLIWVPVLLASPAVNRPGGAAGAGQLVLVALAATAATVAVLRSWPRPGRTSSVALVGLGLAVLTGSLLLTGWSPAWLLLAMTAGVTLPPRWAVAAVPLVAVAAAVVMTLRGELWAEVVVHAFLVLLAGTAAGVIHRLAVVGEMLRQTREELAVAAVARERERVARDLHDLLGHTLSVMVVKAAAARRLVHADPDAAAGHAADIEQVGRSALTRVRQVIHDEGPPTLSGEVAAARDAFAAAGIDASLPEGDVARTGASLPDDRDATLVDAEPLAWALREGVTNVLRHSGASQCRVELSHGDGRHQLTVSDDGSGADPSVVSSGTGLQGLRRRLEATGGGLDVRSDGPGFELTAWVPKRSRPR